MRRGSRMAAKCAGVANIHQPLDKFQGIIERFSALEFAAHSECQQRGRLAAEVLTRHGIVRAILKTCEVHPCDALILAQKFSDASSIFNVALYSYRECFDAL